MDRETLKKANEIEVKIADYSNRITSIERIKNLQDFLKNADFSFIAYFPKNDKTIGININDFDEGNHILEMLLSNAKSELAALEKELVAL